MIVSFFVAVQTKKRVRIRAGSSTRALTERKNSVTFSSGQIRSKVNEEEVQAQELLPTSAVCVNNLDTT